MKQIEFWMLGLKSFATMTSELEALLKLSANKSYFYEAYDGFKTVTTLKQQYVFIPNDVKHVYVNAHFF